jgi:hypothetical protein
MDVWEARVFNDLVKFRLRAVLYIRMNEHCLYESNEDSRGGVTASFEERASDIVVNNQANPS